MILTQPDKLALLFCFGLIVFFYSRRKRSSLPLPPGPKRLPLFGNTFDIPSTEEWVKYTEWGKEYNSDILYLHVGGTDVIVLNSFKAAIDLCDKRSAIYSSRTTATMVNELSGWGWLMSSLIYGEIWRDRRRIFQKYFHSANADFYRPAQVEYITKMLPLLLDSPGEFLNLSRRVVGRMSISWSYGIETTDDFLDNVADIALKGASESASAGMYLVNVFPFLKYIPEFLPGAGFQKQARFWRGYQEAFKEQPYLEAVEAMAAGTARTSFLSMALADMDENGDIAYQQQLIKDSASNVVGAATDTTVSSIHSFFLSMVCFPEAQMKAQAELDRVISGRLPNLDDMDDLPYLSALVKEVLRWRPVTPYVVPHAVTEDDIYKGYHIPKGATVFANAWAMLHDEDDYPDESSFKPERFLKPDGQLDLSLREPALIAFGFGRRFCPGTHIAIATVWLIAATVLSTMNITKAVDKDGKVIEPTREYHGSLTRYPVPFECSIKARSKAAEDIARSAADSYY